VGVRGEEGGGNEGGKGWLWKSSSGAIERALRSKIEARVLYDRFAAPRTERALEPDVRQGDLASCIVSRLSASRDVGVIARSRHERLIDPTSRSTIRKLYYVFNVDRRSYSATRLKRTTGEGNT